MPNTTAHIYSFLYLFFSISKDYNPFFWYLGSWPGCN